MGDKIERKTEQKDDIGKIGDLEGKMSIEGTA